MRARLGDDVDDFCVKCKRLTNHVVVSLLNDEPAKVRCRTCHGDHDYRHELAPPPKIDSRKAALFKQVQDNLAATAPISPDAVAVPVEAGPFDGAAVQAAVAEMEPEVVSQASSLRPKKARRAQTQ